MTHSLTRDYEEDEIQSVGYWRVFYQHAENPIGPFSTDTNPALYEGGEYPSDGYVVYCDEDNHVASVPSLPGADIEAIVTIPGQFNAHYKNGVITGFVFLPSASDAGYFGPAATLWTGIEGALDIESVDGPFWRAVQEKLPSDDGTLKSLDRDMEIIPEENARGSFFVCEWQE